MADHFESAVHSTSQKSRICFCSKCGRDFQEHPCGTEATPSSSIQSISSNNVVSDHTYSNASSHQPFATIKVETPDLPEEMISDQPTLHQKQSDIMMMRDGEIENAYDQSMFQQMKSDVQMNRPRVNGGQGRKRKKVTGTATTSEQHDGGEKRCCDGETQTTSNDQKDMRNEDGDKNKKEATLVKIVYADRTTKMDDSTVAHLDFELLMLMRAIPENQPWPTFEKHELRDGCLLVTCTDGFSAEWLKQNVQSIPSKNEMSFICESEQFELLCPHRVFISTGLCDAAMTSEEILKVLACQNAQLNVQSWWVYSRVDEQNNGVTLVVGIDRKSCDALKEIAFRPYFGLGRVTVTAEPAKQEINS